jgi:hypothetical protein
MVRIPTDDQRSKAVRDLERIKPVAAAEAWDERSVPAAAPGVA